MPSPSYRPANRMRAQIAEQFERMAELCTKVAAEFRSEQPNYEQAAAMNYELAQIVAQLNGDALRWAALEIESLERRN